LMGEPAHSYAEAGAALAKRGVFSPEDLRLYRAVMGFRNVLVHGYTSVDMLRISQILAGRKYRKLADFAQRSWRPWETPDLRRLSSAALARAGHANC
jgi:Uncharacterized conserved protein